MARPLRIEYPGAFYHVINRGNAGEDIFLNDRDRSKFLEYLEKAVERYGIKIHTYCLMTNHYHLLIETPQPNLSQSIKWVNVSYSVYFNRKRQRKGHLFQGRFKSVLVDADEYLKHLSRYIHLNPLRAGMTDDLISYPWSSYPFYTGKKKSPDWFELNWLLSLFGKNKKEAVRNYRNFVESVDIEKLKNPADDLVSGFILGGQDFVNWIKETFLSNRIDEKEIPQLKALKPKVKIESIITTVSDEFGCEKEQILQKGLKNNTARDVCIFLSRAFTGETSVNLGKYFGNISGAGITARYNYIAKKISHNRRLKGRLNRLKRQMFNN